MYLSWIVWTFLLLGGVVYFLSLPTLRSHCEVETEDVDLLQRIQEKKQERQQRKEILLRLVQTEMNSTS